MYKEIPFEKISSPIKIHDQYINDGFLLDLYKVIDLSNVEIGTAPFYVTANKHNFINDPVMIYTYLIGKHDELILESEPVSSSIWILKSNQNENSGFIWPSIDSVPMLGFHPNFRLIMKMLTQTKMIKPTLRVKLKRKYTKLESL